MSRKPKPLFSADRQGFEGEPAESRSMTHTHLGAGAATENRSV
jgi:hypothetical protein